MGFGAVFGGGFRGLFAGTTLQTLVLQPGSAGFDTKIYAGDGTKNYGAATNIETGNWNAGNAGYHIRSLLRFDLAALPSGARVSSAILTMYCSSEANTTDRTIRAHRALTQWFEGVRDGVAPAGGEDGSTWLLRNANGSLGWAGGAGGASGSDWAVAATDSKSFTGTGGTLDFTVTADVVAWVAGTSNYGWWLLNDENATTTKQFASGDAATASQQPKLTIIYEV